MAIFTVTTLVDELNTGDTIEELSTGEGLSLREAVELTNANDGADRIDFAADLCGLVRLNFDANPAPPYTNQLFITEEVTIDGGGVITITGDAQDNDVTASGDITTLAGNDTTQLADNSRVFFVRENADTTLIGLTLTGGQARNENGHGGVIYSQSALTLIDSRIMGNSTTGDNAKGGGIFSLTDITLIDSEIRDNSTSGERSYGGGVAAEGTVTITRSEVSKNFTLGRFSDGGGAYAGGDLFVSASTISGNAVTGNFAADGGGLATRGGLTLTNSTVAYNQVDSYRGYAGGIRVEGDATISHSTIVGNSVAQAPLFSQRNAGPSVAFEADLTVNNSIIVGNVGPTADEPELGAYAPYREYELTFTGLNIVGASADQFDASAFDTVINADPGSVFEGGEYGFGFNGASVRSIALSAVPDNPALDAATGDNIEHTDARGVPGAGARDLGAYELITDASLVVTTGDDVLDATDGLISLREAIYFASEAEGANTVTFAPEVEDTIRLTEGEILVFGDLTVDGGGRITITGDADGNDRTDANGLTDIAASSDADVLSDNSRIFYSVGQNETLAIEGLTLTGGYITTENYGGGAIRANGSVSILNSTVSGNNSAANYASGGGIFAKGGATVVQSTISDNSTGGAYSRGGGIFAADAVTLTDSTIAGNSTSAAAGRGGGVYSTRDVTVTNSTIFGNSTSGHGADGGGVFAFTDATVTSSTITGNSTAASDAEGGGVFAGADTVGGGTLTIANSIVLGNVAHAAEGDEVFKDTSTSSNDGLIDLKGENIIGANSATFDVATQTAGSGTAQNAAAAEVFAATITKSGVAAGALADNGGPVQTIALAADRDNPALDAASGDAPDARGLPRVDLDFIHNGGVADLGAFEVQDQILFAPSFTSGAAFSIPENRTAVGNVTASDDASGVLFAITGGADAALFAINAVTGALSFSAPPDFDAPRDANGDNIFSVEVTATDSDGIFIEQSLTVRVTDVNETDGSGPSNPAVGPTNGADMLVGTAGADMINALAGDDTVHSLAGDDVLIGGGGDDSIKGGAGDDRLRGNRGEDTLKGGGGDDNIKGNGGYDVIRGNGGADVIRAGGGADNVKGGGGDDLILGGGGADRMNGGGGADTLKGNGGDDILRGNGGTDVFQFRTNDRNDTILDFQRGLDKIQIQNGARSFEALSIEQDGRDVLIGFGATGQIRVVTDNAAAFDQDDFIF